MDKTSPGYKQKRFDVYFDEYSFIDDIWDGLSSQDKLREYLPRRGSGPTLESENSYFHRLNTTKLPRAFRDGIEKGIGKFGIATLKSETPQPIQNIQENIDGNGQNLDLFTFRVIAHVLRYGCCAVLPDIDEIGQLSLSLIPVSAIQNTAIVGSVVQRLVVASVEEDQDGYEAKETTFYREYTANQLLIHQKLDDGALELVDERPLIDANGNPRGEVYAVWFSCDPTLPDWTPPAPPFMGLAKDSVLQMHKVSELNRAESICNCQVLKRYHPNGTDPTTNKPDIPWDPETVVEIPFGGDVKVDEPQGNAISITHQRNQDRQQSMDSAVDGWLNEKVRTATEAALSDDAMRSRLEIISKVIESGFVKCFDYLMQLADRRFDGESGGITLSATAYNQVTDEEIKLATDDFQLGALTTEAAQIIKMQQWRSRGYNIPNMNLETPTAGNDEPLGV